jgi:uncharacterized lipoprotein YmbA
MRLRAGCSVALLSLAACASIHADRFYALEPKPAGTATLPPAGAAAVSLKVTVPSLVDRNELVLRQGSGVTVLEHERWAAPLADQIVIVLGQDLEQRRPELMISSRHPSQAGGPMIALSADIVEISATRGGAVSMEVRWRIERAGSPAGISGRERFRQAASGNDYAQVVHAISDCVAQLADRLVQQLPQSASP